MTNKGQGGIGTILMVVALAAIAGFMFWLYMESSSIEPSAPLIDEPVEESSLMASELASDLQGAVGLAAEMDSMRVGGGFGRGVFTLLLPDSVAYPVLMSPDAIQRLAQANRSVFGNDLVFVSGRIYSLNDSIKSAWQESGAVNDGMVEDLPSTPSFLLADSVVIY